MPEKFQIDTVVNAAGVAPGVDETVAGLKKIAASEEDVQAIAQKMGVSLEVAQKALDDIKKEDATASFQKLKESIRAASAEAASLTDEEAGVVNATQGVGKAASEAGEGFDNAVLSNRRSVTHLLRGILEMRSGGVEAIAGLASEGFVAAEGFEAMLGPLYPIIAAVTLLASIGIPLFERWREKTDDAKDSTDNLKKSQEDMGKASEDASDKRIAGINRIIAAFAQQIQDEESYNDELERQAGYEQKSLDNTEKLMAARTALAVAELENQRQLALGSAKSKEEVEAITDRYRTLIEGVQGQSRVNILEKKIQASAQDIADKVGEQNRVRDDLTPIEEELQKHRDATARAQEEASVAGVKPDADGSYKEVRKQLGADVDRLSKESAADRNNSGIREALRDAAEKLQAANKADDYTEGFKQWEEKLGPSADKLRKQFEDLASKIETARADNSILQIEQQTATATAETARIKNQQDAQREAAKNSYENEKADLEAKRKELETQQSNPAWTPDQKASSKASIEFLDARIAQLELDYSASLQLSQAQKTGLRADVKTDEEKAEFEVSGQQKKDDKLEVESLKREVAQLKKQIEAATNDPEILRGAQMIEASLESDPVREVPALQSQLAQAMAAGFTNIKGSIDLKHAESKKHIDEVKRSLGDLWKVVNHHANTQPGGYA